MLVQGARHAGRRQGWKVMGRPRSLAVERLEPRLALSSLQGAVPRVSRVSVGPGSYGLDETVSISVLFDSRIAGSTSAHGTPATLPVRMTTRAGDSTVVDFALDHFTKRGAVFKHDVGPADGNVGGRLEIGAIQLHDTTITRVGRPQAFAPVAAAVPARIAVPLRMATVSGVVLDGQRPFVREVSAVATRRLSARRDRVSLTVTFSEPVRWRDQGSVVSVRLFADGDARDFSLAMKAAAPGVGNRIVVSAATADPSLQALLKTAGPRLHAVVADVSGVTDRAGNGVELPRTATYETLFTPSYQNGLYPGYGGVAIDAAGAIRGTTRGGGPTDSGVMVTISAGGTVTEKAFGSDGRTQFIGNSPWGSLAAASDGTVYCLASGYDAEAETSAGVCVISTRPNVAGGLVAYQSGEADGPMGLTITRAVTGEERLVATTVQGGSNGMGAVFELAVPQASPTFLRKVAEFSGRDGISPMGSPIVTANGDIYGVAAEGGETYGSGIDGQGYGVIYRIAFGSHAVEVVHHFGTAATDGRYPLGRLIESADGTIYGTTMQGGAHDMGTVFALVPAAGGWTYRTIAEFSGVDGGLPAAGVTIDRRGNLLGTTMGGGAHGMGVVYALARQDVATAAAGQRLAPPRPVFDFDTASGGMPLAPLTSAGGDRFVGTTFMGGVVPVAIPPLFASGQTTANGNCGVFYRLSFATFDPATAAPRTPPAPRPPAETGRFQAIFVHGWSVPSPGNSSVASIFARLGYGSDLLTTVTPIRPFAPTNRSPTDPSYQPTPNGEPEWSRDPSGSFVAADDAPDGTTLYHSMFADNATIQGRSLIGTVADAVAAAGGDAGKVMLIGNSLGGQTAAKMLAQWNADHPGNQLGAFTQWQSAFDPGVFDTAIVASSVDPTLRAYKDFSPAAPGTAVVPPAYDTRFLINLQAKDTTYPLGEVVRGFVTSGLAVHNPLTPDSAEQLNVWLSHLPDAPAVPAPSASGNVVVNVSPAYGHADVDEQAYLPTALAMVGQLDARRGLTNVEYVGSVLSYAKFPNQTVATAVVPNVGDTTLTPPIQRPMPPAAYLQAGNGRGPGVAERTVRVFNTATCLTVSSPSTLRIRLDSLTPKTLFGEYNGASNALTIGSRVFPGADTRTFSSFRNPLAPEFRFSYQLLPAEITTLVGPPVVGGVGGFSNYVHVASGVNTIDASGFKDFIVCDDTTTPGDALVVNCNAGSHWIDPGRGTSDITFGSGESWVIVGREALGATVQGENANVCRLHQKKAGDKLVVEPGLVVTGYGTKTLTIADRRDPAIRKQVVIDSPFAGDVWKKRDVF